MEKYFINLDKNSIDDFKMQKMLFLYNALQDGWSIKKSNKSYILRKKHDNKTQVFDELSLTDFLASNMKLDK